MTTPPPQPYSGPSNDDKNLALVAHFGMILFGWLPALIIYLVKGDSPWVKNEAAKAFNFAITITAAYIAVFIVGIVVSIADLGILSCLISLAYLATWVAMAAFAIMNGIKVNDGGESKYPVEIPLLK